MADGARTSAEDGTGNVRAAATSISCTVKGPSISYSSARYAAAPGRLAYIDWSATVAAPAITCTGAMSQPSYTAFVLDPNGGSHTLASGSCAGCAQITAAPTSYRCTQPSTSTSTGCAGSWQAGYRADLVAPPRQTMTGAGTCAGSGQVCTATSTAGYFALFKSTAAPCTPTSATPASAAPASVVAQSPALARAASAAQDCDNNPPSGTPTLDDQSILVIRRDHFPGGSGADDSKGLFYSTVTDNDLANILSAGRKDPGAWVLNKTNYYEKTFSYSGVGYQSINDGAGRPSTAVTVVVAKYGYPDGEVDVITMYPANQ